MAIGKEKYIEIAETDRITITVIFDAMSIKERMEAVLYMLDNYDNCSMPMVKRFMVDENEQYLRCIKEANRPSSYEKKEEQKGLTQEELDVILIDEAVELYMRKAGITQDVTPIPTPIPKSITIEEKKNFYYLLTKK